MPSPEPGTARPFVDQGVGDLHTAYVAVAAAARHWGLPAPELLRVGMNAVFAAGDVVLRAGRPTAPPRAAIELSRVLDRHGVRVAMPAAADGFEYAGLAVTAWERLSPVAAEPDWRAVGAMVARVHGLEPAELPTDYPCPPCTSFPWWHFDELLAELGPMIDEQAKTGLVAAVERHRDWVTIGTWTVCHGDVHPGNVVATASGPVLFDWDLLCTGPPAWDHAMLLRLERWGWPPAWYDAFAAGYGRTLADDPVARALAELRLVAATLIRVRAGRDDPAARPEAERRLRYWRGEPDAATWNAV